METLTEEVFYGKVIMEETGTEKGAACTVLGRGNDCRKI